MTVEERLRRKVKSQRQIIKSFEYLLHCIRSAPQTDDLTKTVITKTLDGFGLGKVIRRGRG